MSDFSVQSTPASAVADHTWLAGDSSAFGTAQSGTIEVASLTSGTHYDATTKVVPAGLAVAKVGDFLVPFDGTSEVQTVTISGAPAGGTFTLTVDGETTAAIAYNATGATVQTALQALSTASDATVTGAAGGPFVVTFGGGRDIPPMTATASFTGGTSPAVAVATTTPGGGDVLAGFIGYPIALLQSGGALSTVVVTEYLVAAVIIPAKLPVAAQRVINRLTPTTGSFAFVA